MPIDTKSLAAKMRDRLNKRAEAPLARVVGSTAELTQVDSWIDMPKYFYRATGAPGLPVGHITQVIGKSDAGKSTLAMMAMIQVQKSGGVCYLIDSEHKFSFDRFRLMGGLPEDLVIIVVDSLEAAWDAFDTVIEDVTDIRKTVDEHTMPIIMVWDSVAASVPDAIQVAAAGSKHVSVDAKINNQNIRKLRKRIRDAKVAAFFINHSYFTMPKYGAPEEVIKGGSEMFFMSTLILKTKRRGWIKRVIDQIDERVGIHAFLEVVKGHLGGTKAITPFYIVGQGVLPDVAALKEYKELIQGIEGPEVNKYTLDELRAKAKADAAAPASTKKRKKVAEFVIDEAPSADDAMEEVEPSDE